MLRNKYILPYSSLSYNMVPSFIGRLNTLILNKDYTPSLSKCSSGPGGRVSPSKIFFSKINKRRFSVLSNTKLDPYYITGLTDAEGCFMVKITINDNCKTGYQISLVFQIALHKKDRILIEMIQLYFKGVGSIRYSKDVDIFSVSSKKELETIIDHFDKYPLITQK